MTPVELLREGVEREMERAGLHSAQYALAHQGKVLVSETIGADPHTRFLLFSATKPLLPAVTWQLMAEGALDPALPVSTWWPNFGQNGKQPITLEHIMIHTAGLPNATLSSSATTDRSRRVAEMEAWAPEWEPGTQYAYHGLSAHWVLAELIERITGTDYRAAVRHRVLDPLGLNKVQLGVPEAEQGDIAHVVHVGAPPTIEEIVGLLGVPLSALPATPSTPAQSDDTLETLRRPDVLSTGWPGGGAVSDAASYALFYQHLLHNPRGLWDRDVLRDATTNARNLFPDFMGRRAFRSLGFELSGDDEQRDKRIGYGATSPAAFGHSGAGGQVAWADPTSGLSFVFLTSSLDANFVRMYRREAALCRLAAACAPDTDHV